MILTSCIRPNKSVPNLFLYDIEERRKQYLESLEYYLGESEITEIVFCDNSGYFTEKDINELKKKYAHYKKKIEIISFNGNEQNVVLKGKSIGEVEIMQYISKNSSLYKTSTGFIKVTGRLKITNIKKIIRLINKNRNYFVYLGLPINSFSNKIDTRCYYMNKSDFEMLLEYLPKCVDEKKGYTLEKSYAILIKKLNIVFSFLPRYPIISGMSGSTGVEYHANKFIFSKIILKNFLIFVFNHFKNIS